MRLILVERMTGYPFEATLIAKGGVFEVYHMDDPRSVETSLR